MTNFTQVLAADHMQSRVARSGAAKRNVLVVGGAGPLGAAVLRQVIGCGVFAQVSVATLEPMKVMLDGVQAVALQDATAEAAIIVLDKPVTSVMPAFAQRRHREAVMLQPSPAELASLAAALRQRGARVLVVVTPVNEATLPNALRHGLRDVQEHALTQLNFDHVLLVRPAWRSGNDTAAQSVLERLAAWMLSVMRYMVPQREQMVLTEKVAAFVGNALKLLPAAAHGTYVADATTLWHSAQRGGEQVVRQWLRIEASTE
jgi:hypothetical protein